MTAGNINYNAVLADLEARKAELESAIAAITGILAASGGGGGSDGGISPDNIPVGAFLRLSIADATKKFLDMVKTKQSVPQIIKALESGGLPPVKYTTLYTVLRRRESQIGDVLRLGDEWALTEWYPNNPNLRKKSAEKTSKGKTKKKTTPKKKKTTASALKTNDPKTVTPTIADPTPEVSFVPALKVPDMLEVILFGAGMALDAKVLAERLKSDFGKNMNAGLLKPFLAHDSKKRFKNVGDNTWILAENAEK